MLCLGIVLFSNHIFCKIWEQCKQRRGLCACVCVCVLCCVLASWLPGWLAVSVSLCIFTYLVLAVKDQHEYFKYMCPKTNMSVVFA